MSIMASSIVGTVTILGAEAGEGKLLGVGAASEALGAKLALLGAGAAVAGLIAVGVVSAKMAADFQQAVNRLRTGAGDTQDSFAQLSSGILKVSTDTGVLTPKLTAAMYEILSSGQRGAQAYATLAAAAKGAVIEQANVVDVSDTLAGTMTNFGTKVFGASQYMNGLMTAVARGRITLQDLSTAMGPIEPVAHAMGVSFADLAAAMSTQTNAAIPAARAATSLRFMMQALEVPTAKASKAMKEWGLDTVAVADEMKVSLPGALQMIYDAAKKAGPEGSVPFNRAVSDMVGGQRSLSAFLALTGTHMKDFASNAAAIAASMKTGAGDVNGWALAQTNFNVILDKAHAVLDALMITIGAKLLPVLGTMVGWFVNAVQYVANFKDHVGVLAPILAGIGAVLVSILVPALGSLVAMLAGALAVPLAIGAAVAGLVAIFMHLYQTSAPFKAFIDQLVVGVKQLAQWFMDKAVPALKQFGQQALQVGGWLIDHLVPAVQAVGAFFMKYIWPALQGIGAFLRDTFMPVWKQLVDVWNNSILPSLKQLWAALQPLLPILKEVGKFVGGVIVVAFGIFVGLLKGTVQAIAGFLQGLGTIIGGVVQVITGIVQTISGIVRFIVDLLTGKFSKLGDDLGTIWKGIQNMFGGTWKIIQGIFETAWKTISGFVSGLVSGIVNFFKGLFDKLVGHSIIPDMINAIVSLFLSLPGKALTAVGSLLGKLKDFFGNLATQALSWGANIVRNIAGGILGSIGSSIGNAMSAVGNFISSHMPHSPAKVGPLRDLALQGSKISEQIGLGIISGMPHIASAVNSALRPISVGIGVTGGLAQASMSRVGSGQQIIVQPPDIYLDGVRLSRQLLPHIHKALVYNVGGFGR